MKLLVTDLDGTLFEVDKDRKFLGLTKRNKEALLRWRAAGHKVLIASARSAIYSEELFELLGFFCDYIGSNGSDILLDDGRAFQYSVPLDVFKDVYTTLMTSRLDASIFSYYQDEWHWSSRSNYPHSSSQYDADNKIKTLIDLTKIQEDTCIAKFSILTDPKNIKDLKRDLIESYPNVSVVSSDIDKIDIGPLNINKASAIHKVLQETNLSFEDIIVVGDSENDIDMFLAFESSYCIDHAERSVSKHAKHHIESVSHLIEKELLKEGEL